MLDADLDSYLGGQLQRLQREARAPGGGRAHAHRRLHRQGGRPRWLSAPIVRSNFYDWMILERPFGGMKRSRTTMSFVDPQPRGSRASRHRARLYGNSVG